MAIVADRFFRRSLHGTSGEAQMASEGIAATFFYRLLAGTTSPKALLERYNRLFAVLSEHGGWHSRAPLIDLVRGWGQLFPEDRSRVTRVFLDATGGATVSADLQKATARLSCAGARGNLGSFLSELPVYRDAIAGVAKQVQAGELSLDANLAPELWIADPKIRIPTAPWDEQLSQPLVIDLNTADRASLAYLFRGDTVLASRLIEVRLGSRFSSIDDAVARANLTPSEASKLRDFHRQVDSLPPFTRH